MYTITFTDQYGNSVTYHAVTREQAEQIASEYASDYPGCSVSITGSEPSPAQSPDVQAIAEENVNEPHYRVIFKNKEGSSAYTAQTLQQAKQIAEQESKLYKGDQVLILTPNNKIERVTFRQIRVPRSASPAPSPPSSSRQVTDVEATKLSPPTSLDLDGALRRAAMDSSTKKLKQQSAEPYAWQLLRRGYSLNEVAQKVANKYGTQVSVEDMQFSETPMHAIYKAMQQQGQVQKTIEKQNVRLNAPPPNTLIGEDRTVNTDVQKLAISNLKSEMEEPDPVSDYLHQISKEIKVKATPLEKVYAKGNPASAYVAATGLAVAGAAAGVLDLPYDVAKGGAEAVEHPVKAAESFALAPVTVVKEAAEDAVSGRMVDYGKIVGQTLVAGEVADELGITPSRAIEKIPYSEKVLAPAKEFAERATAKLNDVVVRPLTEYKPVKTAVIVDTGEEKPVVTVAKSPETASLAAIKDVGRVKEIKPVTGLVAETAFNLKAEPVEDIAEYKNPTEEGTVKVRGESVEGKAFTKARLKTGYELQTENPVRSVKVVTEYANRLGRKAVLASELGEDSVKLLLKKGDEIKGYGVKVVDTYPLWDQESLGNLRVFPEEDVKETIDLRNEETAKPIETIDLREMDENVRKAVLGDEEKNGVKNTEERVYGNGEQTYELKDETSQSRFKVVDISDELRTLENELNDEIELPDISKTFEKAIDFGKDVLDIGMGTGIGSLEGIENLVNPRETIGMGEIPGIHVDLHTQNSVVEKPREKYRHSVPKPETGEKQNTNVSPDVIPVEGVDVLTQALTATIVTPDITPEPETKAKSESKIEPPELPLFIPSGGGSEFYRILEDKGVRFGRAVKVNPVVTNPLTVLFGGGSKGKKKSRRKRR